MYLIISFFRFPCVILIALICDLIYLEIHHSSSRDSGSSRDSNNQKWSLKAGTNGVHLINGDWLAITCATLGAGNNVTKTWLCQVHSIQLEDLERNRECTATVESITVNQSLTDRLFQVNQLGR